MYKIRLTENYPCDASRAYDITVNEYGGVEKYLPNIDSMVMVEQDQLEGEPERRLMRFSASSHIPRIARALYRPEMLGWDQELICYPDRLVVEWVVIPHFYAEYFHCSGRTTLIDHNGACLIEVTGTLQIEAPPIPGVPKKLVEEIVKIAEPFIGDRVNPNLSKYYRSIKKIAVEKGLF